MVVGLVEGAPSFVVGDCNRHAADAAQRFIDITTGDAVPSPGLLCLVGTTGTGKTALLNSIEQRLDRLRVRTTTGLELVDWIVDRVRHGRHRDDGYLAADVVIADSYESLASLPAAATEVAHALKRAWSNGTSIAVAETTATDRSSGPAIDSLLRILKPGGSQAVTDEPIVRLRPLDRLTTRTMIDRSCRRRGIHLDQETLAALSDDRPRSGAEVDGLVTAIDAHNRLDPPLIGSPGRAMATSVIPGASSYEQRAIANVSRAMDRSPHGAIGVTRDEFRDMILAWLLDYDLEMPSHQIGLVIDRSVGEVRDLLAAMQHHSADVRISRFVHAVRP